MGMTFQLRDVEVFSHIRVEGSCASDLGVLGFRSLRFERLPKPYAAKLLRDLAALVPQMS